ncbi:MAG: hypothetical protein AAGJ46_09030 [Planctomycetota bacterium]
MSGITGDDSPAGQNETLGHATMEELAQRGLRGGLFDYAGYQKLRSLATADDVQSFLDANGYAAVLVKEDPVWTADGIEEALADKSPPIIVRFDLGILAYPLWLLTRLRKKRRVFPVKKKNKTRYRSSS